MSDYDVLGEAGVRSVVTDLVDRMFDDFIIGFLFQGKDRARIVRHEIGLATAHLGGPRAYGGRPLPHVHRPLRINRGQFGRRIAILRTVLIDHRVDAAIAERWLDHDLRLEASITDGTDCVPAAGT